MADLSSGVAVGAEMIEKVKRNRWKAHEYEFFYEPKPSMMESMRRKIYIFIYCFPDFWRKEKKNIL